MIDKICDDQRFNCTGCGACSFACPKQCIEMKPDSEGFEFPVIDPDECVGCGRCISICPNNKELDCAGYQHKVWAFQGRGDISLRSSSGGAFYALAINVISAGGVVYGMGFFDGHVSMLGVTDISSLEGLRGSRYVQSTIKDSFGDILKDAKLGKQVLVCGTPCQIAALNSVLPMSSRSNVLLADLICHGVPSPELFAMHCAWIQSAHGTELSRFDFRDKLHSHWMTSKHFCYCFKDGSIKHGNWKADPYYNAYLKALIMRECCYKCRYATLDRCSDITLGDYWGLKNVPSAFNLRSGVSALVAHSEKGVEAIESLAEAGVLVETLVAEVVEGNPNLCNPTKRPGGRDDVYLNIKRLGYEEWARHQVRPKDKMIAWIVDRLPLRLIPLLVKLKESMRGKV